MEGKRKRGIHKGMAFLESNRPGRCLAKICGLLQEKDVRHAAKLGADAVGINYFPRSKRFVPPENRDWLENLGDLESCVRVGVFVNADCPEILRELEAGRIAIAQLHGDESPEDCNRILEAGFPVIKAFAMENERSLVALKAYHQCSGWLLDAYCGSEYGGGGKTFNWNLARKAIKDNPDRIIVLSGGLNAKNATEAAQTVCPYALDVASGVETRPGEKDWGKVRRFIETTHG